MLPIFYGDAPTETKSNEVFYNNNTCLDILRAYECDSLCMLCILICVAKLYVGYMFITYYVFFESGVEVCVAVWPL